MCGIAGLVGGRRPIGSRKSVRRMMDLLQHRGPDDHGIYEDEHACLGHRRLSIIDLTPSGHQPMVDEENVLLHNGEIYNYKGLRKELERKGDFFYSQTDTEVLLRGYRRWGKSVVEKIKGMFAFSLWDRKRQRLFCARDPFGKKPFYYCWRDGLFIFASEIEALVSELSRRPNPDLRSLSHYLLTGYFRPGATAYESIYSLKAGHFLEVDVSKGILHEQPYAQMNFDLSQNGPAEERDLLRVCDDIMQHSVQRRLQSDVPVGVLLSGGVDSSLIALGTAGELDEKIRTFSVAFKGTSFDESRYASEVASRIGSNHTELGIEINSLKKILSKLIDVYGEPFGDYSAIPTFYLFEALQSHVKVVLTGDGGDEVFGGYKDVILFLFREAMWPIIGLGDFLNDNIRHRLIWSKRRKCRELGYALIALKKDGSEVFDSLWREGWTSHWREQMMRPESYKTIGGSDLEQEEARRFISSGKTDLERYLNLRLERLTQAFLVKIDRASMAHSVEARCPFLDVDLFKFASGLSKGELLRRWESKRILKDILCKYMGRSFSRRRKMGFVPPLANWLRKKDIGDWVEIRLTAKESFVSSLFEPKKIRRLLQLQRGGQNHTGRIWKLLFLNEWHARFFGKNSFVG